MATVIQGKQQLSGTFAEMWLVTETVNFGAAATGSGTFASVDVTVPNVALGDMLVAVSMGVDTIDAVVSGAVTAAGVVTLTLLNNSAGAIDLASTTCKFIVGRPSW
jgi:hypothetical protein